MSHRAHIVMVGMSQMTDEERTGQERVNFHAWQCSFLPGFFLLIAVLPAQSQEVPVLNVDPVCRGIAQQASDPSEKGGPDLPFSQCIKSEQAMRQRLVEEWAKFAPADKSNCVAAEMAALPSYTDLLTCLQMASDARRIK
jgi:hypothetical protein